jgi:hypothetical protein
MVELRNPPSGPPIKNSTGGALNPGPGLIQRAWKTRLAAVTTFPAGSVELSSDMTGPDPQDFRVSSEGIKADLEYVARVRGDFRILDGYAGTTSMSVSLWATFGSGGGNVFLNNCVVPLGYPPAGGTMPMHLDFESEPFLPTALGGWNEGEEITVRCEISVTTITPADTIEFFTPGQIGSAIIELSELF